MGPYRDGELQGAARRRDRRRAAAQRHRQGHEGRPARARRARVTLSSFSDLRVVELGVRVAGSQVVDDPQLITNDGFVEVKGTGIRSVNGPITFSDAGPR